MTDQQFNRKLIRALDGVNQIYEGLEELEDDSELFDEVAEIEEDLLTAIQVLSDASERANNAISVED